MAVYQSNVLGVSTNTGGYSQYLPSRSSLAGRQYQQDLHRNEVMQLNQDLNRPPDYSHIPTVQSKLAQVPLQEVHTNTGGYQQYLPNQESLTARRDINKQKAQDEIKAAYAAGQALKAKYLEEVFSVKYNAPEILHHWSDFDEQLRQKAKKRAVADAISSAQNALTPSELRKLSNLQPGEDFTLQEDKEVPADLEQNLTSYQAPKGKKTLGVAGLTAAQNAALNATAAQNQATRQALILQNSAVLQAQINPLINQLNQNQADYTHMITPFQAQLAGLGRRQQKALQKFINQQQQNFLTTQAPINAQIAQLQAALSNVATLTPSTFQPGPNLAPRRPRPVMVPPVVPAPPPNAPIPALTHKPVIIDAPVRAKLNDIANNILAEAKRAEGTLFAIINDPVVLATYSRAQQRLIFQDYAEVQKLQTKKNGALNTQADILRRLKNALAKSNVGQATALQLPNRQVTYNEHDVPVARQAEAAIMDKYRWYQGAGLKGTRKSRLRVAPYRRQGRGIGSTVATQRIQKLSALPSRMPLWIPMGVYDIHALDLLNHKFRIRYSKNKTQVRDFPPRKVSPAWANFIHMVVKDRTLGDPEWNNLTHMHTELASLPEAEQEAMLHFFNRAKIFPIENSRSLVTHMYDQKFKRFELVKGEIEAGNDNKELKQELKTLAYTLRTVGRITASEFNQLVRQYL